MTRILYAAMTGGFGSLAQALPVLRHLDPARFAVKFSIHHAAAQAVRALGFEWLAYPEVEAPRLVTPPGRQWRDLDEYWGRFGFADERYLRDVVESRLRLVEELRPDALVTQFCPPTEIIARITGIPLISFTQSCWHPDGKDLCWWGAKSGPDYAKVVPVVNAILTSHGAPEIARMQDLSRGDLTIIPSFPELDPVGDPQAHYTGPMIWSSANEVASAPDLSALGEPDDPLIVVYTGHLHDSAGRSGQLILERTIEALGGGPYRVLVTTGLGQPHDRPHDWAHDRAPALARPANVLVREWVPLSTLLRSCQLFIHHGGHGSCMAAFTHRAPSLVIPTFQEREFNARQLAALGLGDFVLPDELSAASLRAAVSRGLERRARVVAELERWHQELRARGYDHGATAARLIAELVSDPGPGRESTRPGAEPGSR